MATKILSQDIATLDGNIAMGSNKITGLANGTASTDAAAFGQVKYLTAPVQTINSTAFTTTLNTYQTTNLSASITPSSASSRVKITVTGILGVNAASANAFLTIARGTTDLSSSGNGFASTKNGAATTVRETCAITYIDSPATTSSTTYNIRLKNDDNATTVNFGNAADNIIILEEIR